MSETQVLIAGAGPTGLVLALWLTRAGVPVRIVDPSLEAGTASRAMAVQARTLEFYAQLGIAERVVAGGVPVDHLALRANGREVSRMGLAAAGTALSPFPFVLAYPQDDHERLLEHVLAQSGVLVERGTEVTGLEQNQAGVSVRLTSAHGEETAEVAYLCGCDGAGSRVRHALGLAFEGGTYGQLFYVADAMVSGEAADGGVHLCTTAADFCLVLPVRRTGSYRLIGTAPPPVEGAEPPGFDSVAATVARDTGLTVHEVNWFSTYRVHHRMASQFAQGRVFLAGDAAHIHSPVGGQGMNTGIGDAVNLAWKLAAVLKRRANTSVLDTYATERMGFARRLVRTTDAAFRLMASDSSLGRRWRGSILPTLARGLMRRAFVPRLAFGTVSQTRIRYRSSALSGGRAGKLRGGDRLPWVALGEEDNFMSLTSCDWQLHVYGEAHSGLHRLAYTTGLSLHTFTWSDASRQVGLQRDAVYLIRPDGYIAQIMPQQDDKAMLALANFIALHGIETAPANFTARERRDDDL